VSLFNEVHKLDLSDTIVFNGRVVHVFAVEAKAVRDARCHSNRR
jgi:hypothetical protein